MVRRPSQWSEDSKEAGRSPALAEAIPWASPGNGLAWSSLHSYALWPWEVGIVPISQMRMPIQRGWGLTQDHPAGAGMSWACSIWKYVFFHAVCCLPGEGVEDACTGEFCVLGAVPGVDSPNLLLTSVFNL